MQRPRGFWPRSIKSAIAALGRDALLTDVYDWMDKNLALSQRELAASPHQGRPYFVHTVRGVASDMVKRGELIRVSRGRFRL